METSKALIKLANQPQTAGADESQSSMEQPLRIGLTIFFLVFGVFGVWAAVAPLGSAALAPGQVTVKSYKKIVQHLEGGIVKEILAQDGDRVQVGDPLLRLDETQPAAELESARSQFFALKAREARLIAERDGLDAVTFPELLTRAGIPVTEEITAQNAIFAARKAAHEGSKEIFEQRVQQLETKLVGLRALRESKEELAASYNDELEDTRVLLSQGFSERTRLRELERNHATYRGEAADLTANISSTEVQIGETRLQILMQDREMLNEVVTELGDTQTRLKEINERIRALEDIVSRTVVRAPESGVVNGMQVHTVGGVVSPGSPIAEIVPATDELIIEASVSPNDIDRVAEGQEATIRFPTFGSSVPSITGEVLSLSADSLVDQNTQVSYYRARIAVTPEGIEELGDLALMPGMPAEAFINTGSRTFLQYLAKPITNALARSFNED